MAVPTQQDNVPCLTTKTYREWPKGRHKVPKALIRSLISPHPNLISICGMCRNEPDPWRPHSQANSTYRVHCQCPNARHHRTPLVVLLLCINVFQPLWWHKENVHNICFLLSGPSIMKCYRSTLFCITTWNIAILFIGHIIQPWLTGPPTSWK